MLVMQAVTVRRHRAKHGAAAWWRMAAVCGLAALSATAARGETLAEAIARAYQSNPALAAQRRRGLCSGPRGAAPAGQRFVHSLL